MAFVFFVCFVCFVRFVAVFSMLEGSQSCVR